MINKLVIGAAVVAAVVGAGGTALAVTGSDAPTGGSASSAKHAHHHGLTLPLNRLEHAQVVIRGKDGAVTRDLIHGTVTAVSGTAISVKAADGTAMTFAVTKDTTVRSRTGGKASTSSISSVTAGHTVLVSGTGTTHLTARRVVDLRS